MSIQDNKLQFFPSPASAWKSMYVDCKNASESIYLEQYIFNDDRIGHRFLNLFARKAKEGIKVRIILDGVGSRMLSASPLIDTIRRNGGKVIFFNPLNGIKLLQPFTWLPRDHAKTLVVDGHIGYTGGVCIADYMKSWRDLHVRIIGSLAADMKRDFMAFWATLVHRHRRYKRRRPLAKMALQYIAKPPLMKINPIYHEILREIKNAKERIYIVTPYFLPPFRLRHMLRKAAKRGVDVAVMLSNVTDNRMIDKVMRSYFPSLLENGIKIYLYKPDILHAKYAIIDNGWASIGSTNIDRLSIAHNREANIIIRDAATIDQLRQQFAMDLKDCRLASPSCWDGMSLWDKVVGRVGRIFRRFL